MHHGNSGWRSSRHKQYSHRGSESFSYDLNSSNMAPSVESLRNETWITRAAHCSSGSCRVGEDVLYWIMIRNLLLSNPLEHTWQYEQPHNLLRRFPQP